jgi:hypothetical protein
VVSAAQLGRLVGQSILISPPNQPFWKQLAHRLVEDYNASCYETMNTGPDAITRIWNEQCSRDQAVAAPRVPVRHALDTRGVLLMDGLIAGPVTFHHITGSWRTDASIARRRGELGCTFRRERLLQPAAGRGVCGAPLLNFTVDMARRFRCVGV